MFKHRAYKIKGLVLMMFLFFMISFHLLPFWEADGNADDTLTLVTQGYGYYRSLIATANVDILRHSYNEPNITLSQIVSTLDQGVQSTTSLPVSNRIEVLADTIEKLLGPTSSSKNLIPEKFIAKDKRTLNDANMNGYQIISTYDGERTSQYIPANKQIHIYPGTGNMILTGFKQFYLELPESITYLNTTSIHYKTVSGNKLLHDEQVMCIEIYSTESGHKVREIWIDTTKGFLPRRVVEYYAEGVPVRFWESNFATQREGDIWFPNHVTYIYWGKGNAVAGIPPSFVLTFDVKSAQFNQPVSDSTFTITLPTGTNVVDHHFSPPLQYNVGAVP